MTDDVVDALIASALDHLFVEDADFPPDVHERTVADQFARHLERVLISQGLGEQWKVDCDYNRLGLDKKRLGNLTPMLADVAAALGWRRKDLVDKVTGLVVPDVIVHRRRSGKGTGNLIACEVKRVGADRKDLAFDLVKLAGYREELGYEHAFMIMLGEQRELCVISRAATDVAEIAAYIRRLEGESVHRRRRGQQPAANAKPRGRTLQARGRSLGVRKTKPKPATATPDLSSLSQGDASERKLRGPSRRGNRGTRSRLR